MQIIINLVVNGLAVFIASYIIPGVSVDSFFTAVVVAVVLGIVNAVLKPILILFTLPLTILSLGLFTFVINAFLIILASKFVPGFLVNGFISALIFGLVLSIVNSFLNSLTK